MANKSATVSLVLSYEAAGGNTRTEPALAATVPYQACADGMIDIPIGATAGATLTIPFGTITEATALVIANKATTAMVLHINGATACAMAPGSRFVYAGPTSAGATAPLAEATIHPTTTQAAVEQVAYWIFGDPT